MTLPAILKSRRTCSPTALRILGLGKTYKTPTGTVEIVSDFDLDIGCTEYVTLIGHSGCGKSTVLGMIGGLIEPSAGSIEMLGHELVSCGIDRAMVFQTASLLPWMTAYQNVMLAVSQLDAIDPSERDAIARHYLSMVGLDGSMHKHPAELSQGMQQRVGLARAFALSPILLLLDEPFGSLDSLTRIELGDLLLEMLDQKQTATFMVTHDVDEAIFMSDRIVMMTNGLSATVGGILHVPFLRPRIRQEVLLHPGYYDLRSELIDLLEDKDSI